jgi:ribosome recycling factor
MKKGEEELQRLTDRMMNQVDEVGERKEKEILEV